MTEWRVCPSCLVAHPIASFRDGLCDDCYEPTPRGDPWPQKINSTRRSHSRKYEIPLEELIRTYRWLQPNMMADAKHAWNGPCPVCFRVIREMSDSLGYLQLDITEPQLPPLYGVNTRWMCIECNRKKASRTLQQFTADLIASAWLTRELQRQLPLFGGEDLDLAA